MTPSKPQITLEQIIAQVKLDVFGKGVQSAATYSYLWIADQVGHLAVGIILNFCLYGLLTLWLGLASGPAAALAFVATALIVAYWEYRAYMASVREARPPFPLNRADLRANAIIATVYMVIGAGIGLAFHLPLPVGLVLTLLLLLLAVLLAPPWLRQKMIWQKAALPYLSRLANIGPSVAVADAALVEALLAAPAPPDGPPRRLVITGPTGGGLTCLGAAIGTEFAFRAGKARYLTFDKLVHLSQQPDASFPGPRNIGYWPWAAAQLLIIDDVTRGLLLAARALDDEKGAPRARGLELFRAVLLPRAGDPSFCPAAPHSVWLLNDADDPEGFAAVIAEACGGEPPPVIRLTPPV